MSSIKLVYLLTHERVIDRCVDRKIIGLYSSYSEANDAIGRAVMLPGFKFFPDGFEIEKFDVDKDRYEADLTEE